MSHLRPQVFASGTEDTMEMTPATTPAQIREARLNEVAERLMVGARVADSETAFCLSEVRRLQKENAELLGALAAIADGRADTAVKRFLSNAPESMAPSEAKAWDDRHPHGLPCNSPYCRCQE